jgi:hypothetical protein
MLSRLISSQSRARAAILACVAWGALVVTVVPAAAADWPQLQGNAARTGRTADSVAPPYRLKWAWLGPGNTQTALPISGGAAITIAGRVQPVVAGGRVFVGTLEGSAHGINATTGATLWSASIPGGTFATAAVSGTTVVFVTTRGLVMGFDVATGTELWRYDSGYAITSSPCVDSGRVYAANHRGDAVALDAASGTLLWKTRLAAPVEGDLAADTTSVYVTAENMVVYALASTSGAITAQHRVYGQSFQLTNPMIFNNTLWVTAAMGPEKGNEYIFDDVLAASGSLAQEEAYTAQFLNGDTNGGAFPQASRDWRHSFALSLPSLTEPFTILAGPTEGVGNPTESMIVDNSNRVLLWWKTRYPTLTKLGNTFGTPYSVDIAGVNQATGGRVQINNGKFSNMWPGPEVDNLYQMSVGGTYLFLRQRFRGTEQIQLTTSTARLIQSSVGNRDGGDFTGADVVYVPTGNPPPSAHPGTEGHSAVAISGTQIYVSEDFGIVAMEHKP